MESHASPRLEDGVTTARSRKRDPPHRVLAGSGLGRASAGGSSGTAGWPEEAPGFSCVALVPVQHQSRPGPGRSPQVPPEPEVGAAGPDGGPSRRAPRPQTASSPRAVTALPAAPPGCRLHVHGRPPLFFRGKEPCSVNAITFQTAGCQVFITCEFHDGRASALGERAKVRFGWRDHLGPRRTF